MCALVSCSKYAVVKFVGYDSCDIVPTSWISAEKGDDDTVRSWYPTCHITHPKKCLQLAKAGGPADVANSHKYDVTMLYLTGVYCFYQHNAIIRNVRLSLRNVGWLLYDK